MDQFVYCLMAKNSDCVKTLLVVGTCHLKLHFLTGLSKVNDYNLTITEPASSGIPAREVMTSCNLK